MDTTEKLQNIREENNIIKPSEGTEMIDQFQNNITEKQR